MEEQNPVQTPVEAFMATMAKEGRIIVEELPKFDLDTYLQPYRHAVRYDRLIFIGQCSPHLCIEALKAAVVEARKGKNTSRYRKAWNLIHLVAPDEPEANFDRDWVERTDAANVHETARLEREIKGYKNNLVKESIRMGHEEMGQHLQAIGDYRGAIEYFGRMRPDISTTKHVVDLGMHLASVATDNRDWAMAIGHLSKVTTVQTRQDDQVITPYFAALQGLNALSQEKYDVAARHFLEIDGSSRIREVSDCLLTGNDVAVYGGLLSLVSIDRKDLQVQVLDSAKFRSFLELEPHIRRAIAQFVNGRYADCLAILNAHRADYLLDIHLQKHIGAIYDKIRSKCISHYLIPFSCVTLESMNQAFAEPGESIEAELVSMIKEGALKARIDSVSKLVITEKENPRVTMQKQGLDAFAAFDKEAIQRIRRLNLIAADIEVKGTRRSLANMPDLSDPWFESASID